MSVNPQGSSQGSSLLSRIREGMEVYDRNDEHIGHVDEVYFGEASATEQALGTGPATTRSLDTPGENSFVGMIAQAFDPEEVPQELAERLQHSGYIRLDSAGLFRSDRYILPDQIVSLVDDRVHLAATREELIKRR